MLPRLCRLLLVDDDPVFVDALTRLVRGRGAVDVCTDPASISGRASDYDLVLTCLDREPENAPVPSIARLRDEAPTVPVLAVGRRPDPRTVSRALEAGAFSFASKSLEDDELASILERALLHGRPDPDCMPTSDREVQCAGKLIYRSIAMNEALERLDRFAPSNSPVMITGETGTGKDLVARLVHERSGRTGRFEAVNVTALPDGLFERELFGHVRGAFTGAERDHRGLVELCDGGTLFLDEIGALSVDRQTTLLRVIEDGRVRPLGSETDRHVDVRFLVATNEDLDRARRTGRFREDLWFRIARLQIHLPPLRARGADVVDIARTILADRGHSCALNEAARRRLLESRWPGNVRELEGVLEAACLFDDDGVIGDDDLARAGVGPGPEFGPAVRPLLRSLSGQELLPIENAERRVLRDLRAQAVEAALVLADGQKSRASALLGIGRQTLYAWMKDLGYRTVGDDRVCG